MNLIFVKIISGWWRWRHGKPKRWWWWWIIRSSLLPTSINSNLKKLKKSVGKSLLNLHRFRVERKFDDGDGNGQGNGKLHVMMVKVMMKAKKKMMTQKLVMTSRRRWKTYDLITNSLLTSGPIPATPLSPSQPFKPFQVNWQKCAYISKHNHIWKYISVETLPWYVSFNAFGLSRNQHHDGHLDEVRQQHFLEETPAAQVRSIFFFKSEMNILLQKWDEYGRFKTYFFTMWRTQL